MDGNEASQSESSSQDVNQRTMCVSGESTSLSCNNLAAENNNGIQRDANSMDKKIYVIQGPSEIPVSRGEASSTAICNPDDSIISGFFSISKDRTSINFRDITENLDLENNEYSIHVAGGFEEIFTVTANAVCFKNP